VLNKITVELTFENFQPWPPIVTGNPRPEILQKSAHCQMYYITMTVELTFENFPASEADCDGQTQTGPKSQM